MNNSLDLVTSDFKALIIFLISTLLAAVLYYFDQWGSSLLGRAILWLEAFVLVGVLIKEWPYVKKSDWFPLFFLLFLIVVSLLAGLIPGLDQGVITTPENLMPLGLIILCPLAPIRNLKLKIPVLPGFIISLVGLCYLSVLPFFMKISGSYLLTLLAPAIWVATFLFVAYYFMPFFTEGLYTLTVQKPRLFWATIVSSGLLLLGSWAIVVGPSPMIFFFLLIAIVLFYRQRFKITGRDPLEKFAKV